MLCERGEWGKFPPSFTYEIKYDGTRIICKKEGDRISLTNRNGIDKTNTFPEIVASLANYNDNFVIDGELICEDNFSLLAQREHSTDMLKIRLLSKKYPCTYIVFDVLELNGKSLANTPLKKRKCVLREAIKEGDRVKVIKEYKLEDLLPLVKDKKIEGIVAKNPNSPYVFNRSFNWLKFRERQYEDLLILGYELSDKEERPFRSLIVKNNGSERKVASGLTESDMRKVYELFNSAEHTIRDNKLYLKKPFAYAEVSFTSNNNGLDYRFPVLHRLRFDKEVGI